MLTPSQHKTLDFIRRYRRKRGYSPSLQEIAEGIGITSRGVAHRNVQALIGSGDLVPTPGRKRGLRLATEPGERPASIPLLGCIAAGHPIEAIPGEGTLDLTAFILGPNRYALRVKGHSMIEAGIMDGDTVVVESRDTARDGETVVALIDDSDVTLKKIKYRKDGAVQLTAANAAILPMIYAAERVRIQGVVVAVLRSLK